MSGSLYHPVNIQPGSIVTPLQQWAQLYQAQAAEALTRQQAAEAEARVPLIGSQAALAAAQAQAAGIESQFKQNRLDAQSNLLRMQSGQQAPQPQAPQYQGSPVAPNVQPGSPADVINRLRSGGFQPGEGQGAPMTIGASDAATVQGPGLLSAGRPAPPIPPIGRQPLPAVAPGPLDGVGQVVSQSGAVSGIGGLAIPREVYAAAVTSEAPIKGLIEAQALRASTIAQRIGPASNTAQFNAALRSLHNEGWISDQDFGFAHNQFQFKRAFLDSLADPNTQMQQGTRLAEAGMMRDGLGNIVAAPGAIGAIGAVEGTRANARVPSQIAVEQAKPQVIDGNLYYPPNPGVPGAGGRGGGSPLDSFMGRFSPDQQQLLQGIAQEAGIPPNILASLKFGESGVARSAASGDGGASHGVMQMQEGTLDGINKKYKTNVTTEEIKKNPVLATYVGALRWKDLREKYGSDELASMAYQRGEGAMDRWIKDGAKWDRVPSVARERLESAYGVNVGSDVRAAALDYADRSRGADAAGEKEIQIPGVNAPSRTEVTVPRGLGVTTGAGGTIVSPRATEADKGRSGAQIAANEKWRATLTEEADQGVRMNAILDQAKMASQTWQAGKFAPYKMAALSVVDDIGQAVNGMVGKEVWKPSTAVGDWQKFNKDMIENVRRVVIATSTRAAFKEFEILQKAQPADDMSPQGFRSIVSQMQGMNDWLSAKSQAAANFRGEASEFSRSWDSQISPLAFIVARMGPEEQVALSNKLAKMPGGQAVRASIAKQTKFLIEHGLDGVDVPYIPSGGQVGGPR